MKWVKRFILLVFIISLGFGAYEVYQLQQRDVTGPKLTCEDEEISASIQDGHEELMKGVKAIDKQDGDITNSLLIERIEKNLSGADNEFMISYAAFDHSNNIGTLTRKLRYTDYHKPRFTISSPLRFSQNEEFSLIQYVKADDCLDGDISPFIKIEGEDKINKDSKAGIYDCVLQVTNSAGDTATLPVKVEIYEDSYEERNFVPKIILKQYVVYLSQGDAFKPTEYLDYVYDQSTLSVDYGPMVQIEENGEKKEVTEAETKNKSGDWVNISKIKFASNVDTRKKGNYSVVYTYTTASQEYTCNAELLVVVE
ncbi:hypothetical protein [uncultured Robinsoniella sp.]|uniref:hypothetical protein n=1 Tax=uncultured Robinsoniella sp. TaxID=904190 RepID=UPI00374E2221